MRTHSWIYILIVSALYTSALMANETSPPLQKMAGCFKVTYHFMEDGTHDQTFPPVYEQATLTTQGDDIHIQRTLLVNNEAQKHWREVWTHSVTADDAWQQTVYGPFEDLRYSCAAAWVLNQWRCGPIDAPKPRRDAARPYDHLNRENILQVSERRWVHMQINHKRLINNELYATEIGWNEYERVDNALCIPKTNDVPSTGNSSL